MNIRRLTKEEEQEMLEEQEREAAERREDEPEVYGSKYEACDKWT